MKPKIIDEKRYKKISRKDIQNKNYTKKNSKNYSKKYKKSKNSKLNKISNVNKTYKNSNLNNKNISKEKVKKQIYIPKTFKIFVVVLVIGLIGYISKIVINFDSSTLKNVFSNNDIKNVDYEKNYSFKIGISKLDTTDKYKTNNIVLNELYKLSSIKMLDVKTDYSIEYIALESVEKVSDTVYLANLNKLYDITANDIKNEINKIVESGNTNIYYDFAFNINDVEQIDDTKIKFTLKNKNSYFVYTLVFPINKDVKNLTFKISDSSSSSINFIRNNDLDNISSINFKSYESTDDMVTDFRNDKIDMFFASSDSIMTLIGKHDYNVKKYRDGQCLFLFGNKNSNKYSIKEVRQAITFSLNRDEIINEVSNSTFYDKIDIPYIYSDIKYRYDVYGADNVLLSNGWTKTSGIYGKNVNGSYVSLTLKLLVNVNDTNKVKVAEKIKEQVEKNGIRINVEKLTLEQISEKIAQNDFDLVLADVYINNYPDISFLNQYVNINDTVNKKIIQLENSTPENIEKNILDLQNTIYEEVCVIGIMARNTNIVYQKDIQGIEDTNYMKIFNDFSSIVKVKEE